MATADDLFEDEGNVMCFEGICHVLRVRNRHLVISQAVADEHRWTIAGEMTRRIGGMYRCNTFGPRRASIGEMSHHLSHTETHESVFALARHGVRRDAIIHADEDV